MSAKRHKHRGSPHIKTPMAMNFHGKMLATDNHVYHPTKGWRKIRKNATPGYFKIDAFLSRLKV